MPDGNLKINKPQRSTTVGILATILKYGSAVAIAVLATYGARQEKGEQAQARAEQTMAKLRAIYDEQAKCIVELQQAVAQVAASANGAISRCKAESDTLKQNVTWFLFGLSRPGPRPVESKTIKEVLSIRDLPSRPVPKGGGGGGKLRPFSAPRPFEQVQIRRAGPIAARSN